MIYQFLDWRLVRRQMCVLDVQRCFTRLRAANNGVLPLYLESWECIQAFAGEAGILLPEMEAVARGQIVGNPAYPTLAWLADQYARFLLHVAESDEADLLKDPAPEETPPQFAHIVDGSVSNAAGEQCSEPAPATASPTGMSPASPNSLSMGVRRFPAVLRQSTPTLVPKHLCDLLKAK